MDEELTLIAEARSALSNSNWTVGRCAATWTTKYSRGRGDAEFGEEIGLSADQVYARRRTWEVFGDDKPTSGMSRNKYPDLTWSHFERSLAWDDATECLQWAHENSASVAQMRAFHRMTLGDDLTVEADETESAQPTAATTTAAAQAPTTDRETTATAPKINQDTHQAPDKDDSDSVQALRTIINKLRRITREAQQRYGTTAPANLIADELSAQADDLRQGHPLEGLDKPTLDSAIDQL